MHSRQQSFEELTQVAGTKVIPFETIINEGVQCEIAYFWKQSYFLKRKISLRHSILAENGRYTMHWNACVYRTLCIAIGRLRRLGYDL